MSFLSLAFLLVLTSPSQASNNNICILQQQEIDKGGRECASEWSNLFASVVKEPYLDSQYIVRFTSYRAAEEQRKELRGALGPEGHGWTWVERHNKAAAYPTDFGLIQLGKSVLDYFQVLTASFPTIRDIHPDHPITQALKWDSLNQGPLHAKAGDGDSVEKLPGRLRTRPTIGLDDEVDLRDILSQRKLKMLETQKSFASILKADQIWSLGHTGKNIKMGVFDTGVRKDHPHIRNIKERTNWTHEQTLDDGLGHGSFVAGVIASSFEGCRGLAPDVDLHTFRVFTNDQVSFTSWFMDAFNYAIITEMDVVNLSIGGPDYLDEPFVDKVMEITSNGILMVSALGNDGPLYGTLNNPADQNDVIGVGGMTYKNEIASFSSRGMSLWELPVGYGRIKPDVMAYGQDVLGSKISSGCRSLSGTSVASPVAAGAVCLLASTVPESKRWDIVNPASMKQALVEGAVRLDRLHVYEQGNGALNLHNSMAILQDYEPRASLVPASIDLTDCPYMWPFCAQSLYARAMPVMLNATILNGMGVVGEISTAPVYEPSGENGNLIEMDFDYSSSLWPWSGYLALYITVQPSASEFDGTAEGTITFTVSSPPAEGEDARRFSTVAVPFKARIIPTPRRENRLLWDQFHSIRYPPAYIPRDNLDVKSDILDWHGDHLHTNYHRMFNYLTSKGYFLEVLASPLTCFNANEYGALMIVDSEDEFYPEEVAKLEKDVRNSGLGLIVFADWYNLEAMKKAKFFDDNTRSWWTPVTGGANVPALNDLLDPYGIAFGDAVLQGKVTIHGETIRFASGVNIMKFPTGGHLQAFHLDAKYGGRSSGLGEYEVLGLTEVGHGKIAVYGDSNCLDASHMDSECFGLIHGMIDYATGSSESSNTIQKFVKDMTELQTEFYSAGSTPPVRPESVNFTEVSFTLQRPLQCYQNAGHQLPKELIEEFPDVMASTVGVPQAHIVWKEAMTTAEHAPDIVEDDATVQKDEKYKGMHVSGPEDTSQPMPYVLLGNQEGYSKTMGPPALLSRWTLFFGVVIVISLYRVTRRRRVSRERSIRGD